MKLLSKHKLSQRQLLTVACSALLSLPVWSDTDAAIDEVIVSLPLQPLVGESSQAVNVLSGAALRQQIASTLGETLALEPGISSASYGTGVGQPVIRGQQGARVSVLRNGSSVADASNLSVDHVVVVEPTQAQSIEVLRGPAALLYGGGAIGGVVNVIDQRIPADVSAGSELAAELRHGSVNDETVAVLHGTEIIGNYALHADGVYRDANETEIPGIAVEGREETRGRLLNSSARAQTQAFGVSRFLDNGYVGFSYEHSKNKYGIPPSDEQLDEGEFIDLDVRQERFELRGENSLSGETLDALRWSLTYSDYEHTEIASGEAGTVFSNENLESRIELKHTLAEQWQGAAGLQLRTRNFGAVGEEAFIPKVDITSIGVFVLEQTELGAATLEFGARYDYDEVETDAAVGSAAGGAALDFDSFNFSASSLWQLGGGWSTAIALSYAERAPVVEELFSNPDNGVPEYVVHEATEAIEVGLISRDEKATQETSRNIDWTISYRADGYDGFITAYYNDFADFIYLADAGLPPVDDVTIYNYEQADAEFYGIEFELSLPSWQLGNSDHRLTLWGDSIRGQLSSNSEDLPRLPPRRVGLKLNSSLGQLSFFNTLTQVERQNRAGAGQESTAGYTRWDTGAEYQIETGDVDVLTFLRIKNVGNESIRYATSFRREIAPEAGRSVEVGLRFDI